MSANPYLAPSPVAPGFLYITAITQTFPMVVTITNSIYNTYVVNQLVHFSIPESYGMFQLDQLNGEIVNIIGNDFYVALDGTQFDAFVPPNPSSIPTPTRFATLSPYGCRGIYNVTQEPFHSINGNIGN